jgi:serine/threonine-protein kinase RIO1
VHHPQDAGLPLQRLCSAYGELVVLLRRLYQDCRLVHADLSEYNILVHQVSTALAGDATGGHGRPL